MYDLHCHLLPGIDDGARNMEESLALARMAEADGTLGMVVTPHLHPGRWENTPAVVEATYCQLQAALAKAGSSIELAWAAEVRLSDDILGLVAADQIPFYGEADGYRVMLLEFPHGHIVPGSDKLVDWLLARGIRPMIAHPERNKAVMRTPELILPFVEQGCWLQVTANSITGDFGDRAHETAEWLLQRDLVTLVASDAHNARYRTPRLSAAYNQVFSMYGGERAQQLFVARPGALFESAVRQRTG